MPQTWLEVSCTIPESMEEEVAAYLVAISSRGVTIENLCIDTFSLDSLPNSPIKTVKGYFQPEAQIAETLAGLTRFLTTCARQHGEPGIDEPVVTLVADEDWETSWKHYFKPTRVGKRFIIKPSWEHITPRAGDLVIDIDPGMAFGTGTHPTTRLCLEVLEKIFSNGYEGREFPSPITVLDVGTGSGILSIAAMKLEAEHVVAIDIDPQAVETATENCRRNNMNGTIELATTPLQDIAGEFQVVVANILAEDLVKMAPDLVHKVSTEGFLVMSGILTEKEGLVIEGFAAFPVSLIEATRTDEWSCLVFQRRN